MSLADAFQCLLLFQILPNRRASSRNSLSTQHCLETVVEDLQILVIDCRRWRPIHADARLRV